MSEITGILSFGVFTVIPILAVGIIIYIIVQAIKNKDKKENQFKFSTKSLYQIYLYIISFLTLGIALIGGSIAIRSGLAYQFGTPFAYTLYKGTSFEEMKMYDSTLKEETYEVCPDAEILKIGDSDFCVDYQQQSTDLVIGLTILLSMVILFGIHQFAISKISKKERLGWLEKLYTFASLILYSLVGLISIPASIYQLANFLIIKPENYSYSTPEAPAMAMAIALLSLSLWIYFLLRTSHIKEEK